MGTCSYVLVGTDKGFKETWGSPCHGAGRALSRAKARRELTYEEVIEKLKEKNITIRMASPKLVMEEAPESYKDVEDVCNTCRYLFPILDEQVMKLVSLRRSSSCVQLQLLRDSSEILFLVSDVVDH